MWTERHKFHEMYFNSDSQHINGRYCFYFHVMETTWVYTFIRGTCGYCNRSLASKKAVVKDCKALFFLFYTSLVAFFQFALPALTELRNLIVWGILRARPKGILQRQRVSQTSLSMSVGLGSPHRTYFKTSLHIYVCAYTCGRRTLRKLGIFL